MDIPEAVKQYFNIHSLNPDFCHNEFGVTWDHDKIIIPILDIQGVQLFFRYRQLIVESKFTADKGSHPALYAIHKAKKYADLVLCEGEPDCIRLWQEGIPAVTGTSGVGTFRTELALPLKGKNVSICLDTDDAGKFAIQKYYEILTEVGAYPKIVELPKVFKDVSEYFTAGYSKEDFNNLPKFTLEEWKDLNDDPKYALVEGTSLLQLQIPEEKWLIDRILPADGFTFIVGAEATGKSFYTLTLANAVTTGQPWLDKFEVRIKSKVLFIDKENSKRITQERMRGLGMIGKDMYWLEYPNYFELSDASEDDGFSKFIKSASRKVKRYGIGLVIVDSFSDVMIGNENAAGDVQKFFDGFRQMFQDVSILVLHHANKPAQGVPRTPAQRLRGSTNIAAQLTVGFYVSAIPKTKNEFCLEQTKSRDSEKLDKFKVKLISEPDPNKPEATLVKTIEYCGDVASETTKLNQAKELIEELFSDNSRLLRQEIVDSCISEGIGERTVATALRELNSEGILKPEKEGRKSIYVLVKDVAEQLDMNEE